MDSADFEQARITALQNLNLGKPSTFGGVIKNPSASRTTFRQFISHTLPDVAATTQIIAVCGPTDFSDRASPARDGSPTSIYFTTFFEG